MFKWNRFLAAVLSASMVFTMAPVQGLAADQSAMSSQEESVANETEEENDNGADAGSGADQAVNSDSSQGDDNGANAESGANAGADDSGKQDADPSNENDGDDESQSGSDSDAVSSSTEGVSEDGTDAETSDEDEGEEEETSDDVTVTTEAAEEGVTEEVLPDTETADAEETVQEVQSDVVVYHYDQADQDALFEEYANRMFYGNKSDGKKRAAGGGVGYRLEKSSLIAYTKARELVAQVADGQTAVASVTISSSELGDNVNSNGYTAEDLGVSQLYQSSRLTSDAIRAIYQKIGYDGQKVLNALMFDCAYEMYWNKGGVGVGLSTYNYSTYVKIHSLTLYFYVDSKYKTTNSSDPAYDYTADTTKTGAVRTAVNNAGQVVSEAARMSDYYKLNYYREQICDFVEYDHTAAANSTTYADRGPWNLLYVFDNDPSTNVVCEGYAEAFQYLSEKTSFDNSSIEVYSVTGNMSGGEGAGGHKWNIVHMDDGKNYLADITNSDYHTIGSDGSLFLKGMSGTVSSNYYKTYSSGTTIRFTYDSDTRGLYDVAELTLSAIDYGVQGPITADDKAVLKGISLFLTDKIGMRVYVKTFADLADTDYMEFSCAGQTRQVTVADAGRYYISDVDGSDIPVLVFEQELWTKQMTDDVTFHMVVDDEVGTSKTYSVRTYADRVLAGNYSDEEKAMVRAMLNYGGYAQNYLNYNTESLANSSIFDELPDPVQAEDPVLTDYDYTLTEAADTKGFDIQQAALQLGTDVQLVYYYELTGGKTNNDFIFELVGSNKSLDFGYDNNKGLNTVTIRHILPYELDQMFTLRVRPNNSSNPVMTINYGPFSYCKAKIDHGSTAIKNLCKSLYYYWEAACNMREGVTLTINGYTYKVEFVDSNEARAFEALLPMTLTFNFDNVDGSGVFNGSISHSGSYVMGYTSSRGDIFLDGNNKVCVAINNCNYGPGPYKKIGYITNTAGLSSFSGEQGVQVVFSAQ